MNIVLGISASIAAYKAVDLLRALQKREHRVSVVMTRNSSRFVAPLALETFAPGRVFCDSFAPGQDPVLHVSLSKENDLLLVAPASADILGKMAGGIADDLLSTVYLAFRRRVMAVPAMNSFMYEHPALQANLARLRGYGVLVLEPRVGELACGDSGRGRFPEIEEIVSRAEELFTV